MNLNLEQKSFLDGLMLGDGSITYPSQNDLNARLTIRRSFKDKDFIFQQYNIFKEYFKQPPKESTVFDTRTNKKYKGIYLQSKTDQIFSKYREKWYPNGYKIIPKDLVLNDIILYQWFCDDGNLKIKNNHAIIKLSTHGFSQTEVIYLCDLLHNYLGVKFRISKDKSGKVYKYYIEGSTNSALAYIDKIDYLFDNKIMKRKSDKWRINFSHIFNDPWRKEEEYNIFPSKTHYKKIIEYCKNKNELKLSELQKHTGIIHRTMKKILPWFIKKKYIVKKIHPTNARYNQYFITKKGRQYFYLK